MIICDWHKHWEKFWAGKWYKFFPKDTYGETVFDGHMYIYEDTIEEAEQAEITNGFDKFQNEVGAEGVPWMIGEYTL